MESDVVVLWMACLMARVHVQMSSECHLLMRDLLLGVF